jgi:uncharacterized protein YbcC (UPF0753/DUF2309 family)
MADTRSIASRQPDDPANLRGAIRAALDHAAHQLPDQAPIRVFIHHNTLHAFQHLHFHEAVRAAQQVYGAEPYMSEAAYREKLRSGRITPVDLDAALQDQWREGEAIEFLPGLLSDHEIRRLMLHFQFFRETDATLAWHRVERQITRRLRPDVPSDARRRLLLDTQGELRAALDLPQPQGTLRFARLVTGEQDATEAAHILADEYDLSLEARELLDALDADPEPLCVRALFQAALELSHGHAPQPPPAAARAPRLHRDLLLERGASDIYDSVLPELIRLCAAYLDEGLASWRMPDRELGFYRAARALSVHGSRPVSRLMRGVRAEFRRQLASDMAAPDVVQDLLTKLGVRVDQARLYVERLLLSMPGWSGMISRLERKPEDRPQGGPPVSLLELLAVRLTYEWVALVHATRRLGLAPHALWEAADQAAPTPGNAPGKLHAAYQLFQLAALAGIGTRQLRSLTREAAHAIVDVIEGFDELWRRRVFQEAFEHQHRRQILDAFAAHRSEAPLADSGARPAFQLICCFDEREESFRRHVEEVCPEAATYGAPGFFGAAIRFRALYQAEHVALAPVMISPEHHVDERPRMSDMDLHAARSRRRKRWAKLQNQLFTGSRSLWRGMLLNAALGALAALPLLLRILSPRAAGRIRDFADELLLPSPRTELTVHRDAASDGTKQPLGFLMDERVTRVATVLENIGLVRNIAPIVVVLGHGSTTLNNPHKSAYDCGACGGRQGGPNARVFAAMANTREVRALLSMRSIAIPSDTFFVGGQHDTCNDEVVLFDTDRLSDAQRAQLDVVMKHIDRARARNAQERCRRLFSAPSAPSPEQALRHVEARSEHLAQPRPEFGHATNAVAVVGRRGLTRGLFLDRRVFLISYDPGIDESGAILERTLAGALPVGAGINLEYYFSHVDNERYGAGSKLPHNVTGLLGVMTGHASDLRTGLPRQMIEIHEALRLLIAVEAAPERLLEIANRHAEVRQLVVNRWVHLVSVHPETGAMQVFADGGFRAYTPQPVALAQYASSYDAYRGQRGLLRPARVLGADPRGV